MNEKINNSEKGFTQIALFIAVGVILLSFALYSYIPVIKNAVFPTKKSSTPAAQIVPLTPTPPPSLTAKQELLIKHKEKVMADLDLTEEQFIGIVKMASDPEFNY